MAKRPKKPEPQGVEGESWSELIDKMEADQPESLPIDGPAHLDDAPQPIVVGVVKVRVIVPTVWAGGKKRWLGDEVTVDAAEAALLKSKGQAE